MLLYACKYFIKMYLFSLISVLHYILIYIYVRRSVLGETVPEVLSTARGRRPRALLRPRAQFLPIRTDLGRWITFSFFVLLRFKSFRKILLQPPTYVCWRGARSIANQNKTLQHYFWTCNYIITIKLSFRIKKGFCFLVDNS